VALRLAYPREVRAGAADAAGAARTASETVRRFFAIELDGALRCRLARQAEAVVARVRGLRAVPEPNLHLTVQFLGAIGGADLDHLESLAPALAAGLPPFRFELHGLGAFPAGARARVVWVGARDSARC